MDIEKYDGLNTDEAIISVIESIAQGRCYHEASEAHKIWDSPTQDQLQKVIFDACMLTDDTFIYWGVSSIDVVKVLLDKAFEKILKVHGEEDGAILLEPSYHACCPEFPEGWTAKACVLTDFRLSFGKVFWDFKEFVKSNPDVDDAGTYPWSGTGTYSEELEYNIHDDLSGITYLLGRCSGIEDILLRLEVLDTRA